MTGGIDGARLLERLRSLGDTGRDPEGRLTRLAGSDEDRAARDRLAGWFAASGLAVAVDRIGNLFGLWTPPGTDGRAPILLGSHIDTVVDAGIYDGCLGVLAGLAVIEALQRDAEPPRRPVAVAAFTNEEGVRYAPDMMGSLVAAGGLGLEAALATRGTDGTMLGDELVRIGYAGPHEPGFLKPHAYLELHIEQGPVLEREGAAIGAVEGVQGISWQRLTITGEANHAGTTPMAMRRDAGVAAARIVTALRDQAVAGDGPAVATVGCLELAPAAINVVPGRATLTVDLRDPDEVALAAAEADLADLLARLAAEDGVAIATERLARFAPVRFDEGLVRAIEAAARARNLGCRRIVSGAGHDAQMMARLCPSAMIFVPSRGGISHNPHEWTDDSDAVAGASLLLEVVRSLATFREAR